MRFKVHRSQPKGFKSLAQYLPGKDGKDSPERVAWKYARNLPTDAQDIAAEIMEATAAQNTRCRNPAYHFMISFDPKDARAGKISEKVMREIADDVIKRMGLSEYQALIYAHRDKDHPHIHFLVNRIQPQTLKAYSRHEDGKRLHTICRDIARERGLNIARDRAEERAKKQERIQDKRQDRPDTPARDVEDDNARPTKDAELWQARREGRTPLRRFGDKDIKQTREIFHSALKNAESWDELSQTLSGQKLYLARKGQGLIISDGERYAKLSEMGKGSRLAALEDRFEESFYAFSAREADWIRRTHGRGAVLALDDADDEYRYWSTLDQTYCNAERATSRDGTSMHKAASLLHEDTNAARESKSVFLSMLGATYRNGRAALRKWNELERRYGPQETLDMIKARPSVLGQVQGMKYARGLSPKRKLAEKTFRKLLKHRKQYITAQNRVEFSRNQYLEAKRKLDLARHDFDMMQLRLGSPAQFRKIIHKKIRARYEALERVTEQMVNQADIAEERRLQLVHTFRQHRRNRERERQRALERGRIRGR